MTTSAANADATGPRTGSIEVVADSLGMAAGRVAGSAALPEWCPAWAERLGDAYLSGTSCVFMLHGNVRDLVPVAAPAGGGRDEVAA